MFEIIHKCKELEFANSINAGDIIIHYGNWGANNFKEWIMRNEELDNGLYVQDQIIDTLGIKFCPYCGKELNEDYAEQIDMKNITVSRQDNNEKNISLDEIKEFIKSQRLSEIQANQQMEIFKYEYKLLESYNEFHEED